jgi:fucose permease
VPHRFARTRSTWLAYGMLAFYGYFLNALGPVTPFLRAELRLSYTLAGWHFSAFAAGILLAGLASNRLVRRVGRWRALWIGASGLEAGCLVLVLGRHPLVTIGGTLLMGAIGSAILPVVASSLSDEHGGLRAIALTEANLVSSLVSSLAGAMVGLLSGTFLGWRGGLLLPLAAAPLLYLACRRVSVAPPRLAGPGEESHRRLPATFWLYWAALVAAVSVEFCLIFWAADYLEDAVGVPRREAALSVSVFLVAMVLGRLAGARVLRRVSAAQVVHGSLAVAMAGFLIYWRARAPGPAFLGLFVCGMGVACLYPTILSLALATTEASDAAAARATLASGVAIFSLPLLLAAAADALGIRAAHAIVAVLLGATWLLALRARRAGAPRSLPSG